MPAWMKDHPKPTPKVEEALRRMADGDPQDRLMARIRAKDGPFPLYSHPPGWAAMLADDDDGYRAPDAQDWSGVTEEHPSSEALIDSTEVVETGASPAAPPASALPDSLDATDRSARESPRCPDLEPGELSIASPRVRVRQDRWKS